MNGHERMKALMAGKPTDQIPHFEMVFQIAEEAFGLNWPDHLEMYHSTGAEWDGFKKRYFEIWDKIIDIYHWDAVPINWWYHEGELIREARERYENKAMVFDYNGNGTFWMPLGGEALWDFSMRLVDDRPGLHEEAERKLAESNELARKQVESGAEFIIVNSDYAMNDQPFISPDDFNELVTPYLKRNVDYIHSLGVKAILHSDGDLRQILDDIVGAGIDGYQSIDPQGNMDIKDVKERYGDRLILMGNVKTALLQDVNDEEIRESARYCLTHAKPGGGYIFSTSNCLFAGMPLESYHIMLDEFDKHKMY